MLFRPRSPSRHFKTVRGRWPTRVLKTGGFWLLLPPPNSSKAVARLLPSYYYLEKHFCQQWRQQDLVTPLRLSLKKLQMASSVGNVADSTGTGVPFYLGRRPGGALPRPLPLITPFLPSSHPHSITAIAQLFGGHRPPVGVPAVCSLRHLPSLACCLLPLSPLNAWAGVALCLPDASGHTCALRLSRKGPPGSTCPFTRQRDRSLPYEPARHPRFAPPPALSP